MLNNLLRDPREMTPIVIRGMWTVGYFEEMLERHMAFLQKYPNRKETQGIPYAEISNLRPETQAFIDRYAKRQELLGE